MAIPSFAQALEPGGPIPLPLFIFFFFGFLQVAAFWAAEGRAKRAEVLVKDAFGWRWQAL